MIKTPLSKILFMDIETVGGCPDYDICKINNPLLAEQFDKYYDWFEKRFPEIECDSSDKNIMFMKRSALVPEFAKIICISFAFVTDTGVIKKQSYFGDDEFEILSNVQKLLERCGKLDFYLCGHNIKNFDISVLSKRMIVNGLMPPSMLPSYDTKPWDMKVIDTKEIWQYNSFGSIGALDLLCASLNIPSSKDGEIKGDGVHNGYWFDNKLKEIVEYCEKDVEVLVEIIKKFKNLK
jgi:predicted PolB exonuclease-like 3'-5' exonuclease